jgi:ubiquinone/menaquinone biosynthesis C-methylase UbiE
VDYDSTGIAAVYDRGRDLSPHVIDMWMRALGAYVQDLRVTRILDLGCGTGRFSGALAEYFGADVVGIDPSKTMLEQARIKLRDRRVRYGLGHAEAIPLQSGSVDMILMSMSFHHFTDAPRAAAECRRVLRQAGVAFVRTGTRERADAYPYVRFFPSTRLILEEVLPGAARLREVFETAGLRLVASDAITQMVAAGWEAYADKLAAGGDSVLARLGDEELQGGLAALRRQTSATGPQAIVEPIDLFVFR